MKIVRRPYILLLALLATHEMQGLPQDGESNFERLIAEAQRAQASADFRAAANAYQGAAAIEPSIPELWADLGLMEHQLGSYQDAIANFQKALLLNSNLLVPNLFLGIDLLEEKHYEEALPYLLKAEKVSPSDLQAAIGLGRAYGALRQPRKAMDAYAKAIHVDEKNADAWFGLGVMSLEQIERDARLLLAEQRSSAFADALTAEAFEQEGKQVEASTYFARAVAEPASPLCFRTEFAMLLTQQHAGSPVENQHQTDDSCPLKVLSEQGPPGITNIDAQRHTCARGHLPAGTSEAEFETACSFYSGDYWSASVRALEMQSVSSTRPAGLYWEIRASQRLAVAALDRAGQESPNSAKMHVLIGDVQRQRKHLQAAQDEYNKALALKPGDPGALLGLGVTRLLLADLNGALKAGQTLLQANPSDARTNLLVAEALMALHRYEDAEPYLNHSLDIDPELLPRVHELLGRYYSETGQDTKAVREFELALKGDEDGSVHYQLALIYRKDGDTAQAAPLFEASKRLHEEQRQRASVALQEIEQTPDTAVR